MTWYKPGEKIPPKGKILTVTISGKTCDHVLASGVWYGEEVGWILTASELKEFTIHAWCDLEPYKGE